MSDIFKHLPKFNLEIDKIQIGDLLIVNEKGELIKAEYNHNKLSIPIGFVTKVIDKTSVEIQMLGGIAENFQFKISV